MANVAPAAPQAAAQRDEGNPLMNLLSTGLRTYMMYYMFQQFMGRSAPPPSDTVSTTDSNVVSSGGPATSLWPIGIKTDLAIWLSEEDSVDPWDGVEAKKIMQEDDIVYGNWDEHRILETTVDIPYSIQHNGTLYAHIFWGKSGWQQRPGDVDDVNTLLYRRKLLTRYLPKKKEVKLKKLMGGNEEKEEKQVSEPIDKGPVYVSYWYPNLTLCIVGENSAVQKSALPAPVSRHIHLVGEGRHYTPIFFVNDFWMLGDKLMTINDTVTSLPLRVDFYPLSMFKFQLYQQMEENLRTQETMMGQSRSETDEFKRMLVETNPYLLGVTFAVSTLHSIFDFLAFKNDIQFWKDRKTMEGLSFRSILTNVVFQFIIFLYLFDNDTSWMIIISTGVGLLIEIWKVTKAVDISIDRSGTWPKIVVKDKGHVSKKVKLTQKYDAIAFKYMSYALIPCLIGYTIYSALYQEHKGWYSFIVSTLVGFVYAFGFISMTPQLYINYKLKSVAHMPWKTFMYKALNTFIDDLFAFIIKMPWLHRLACFRDDIIFFIYLYQRWIYPVDHRRRNEFGQVGEEGAEQDSDVDEELLKEIEGKKKEDKQENQEPKVKKTTKPELRRRVVPEESVAK